MKVILMTLISIIFMYLMGNIIFVSKHKHLLIVLLSLEFIVLSIFILMEVFLSYIEYDMYMLMVFLVFSVCEGALGLSILVSMIRTLIIFKDLEFYKNVKIFNNNNIYNSFMFKKKMFWMVQSLMFMMMFLFMNLTVNIMNFSNMSYMFSCDLISFGLILLSIWISVLMIMASENLYKNNFYIEFFLLNIILLLIMLFLTFSAMNLFLFYFFFEGSLIPTLLLILGWGYQPERIQAGMYLLFYTLFASLPLLLGIFYIFDKMNYIMIYFLKFFNFDMYLLYFCMVMAFLVKMPMYFVHLWLPKAHVEAPQS